MPRIGRELRALGITVNTNNASENQNMAGTLATATATSTVEEIFELNPCAGNIKPSSTEGAKLYSKATEELLEDQKIKMSIENGHKVRDALEKNRSKFAWVTLPSRVEDENSNRKEIIKNYRLITKNDVLRFNNLYLGNGNREMPPANMIMIDLDPRNNNDHKKMFTIE